MFEAVGENDPDGGRILERRRSRFFLIAALLMTLIVFLGFLPSFYLRAHFRTTSLPGHLIVHALIMTAWQLFFLGQTILIAIGRTDLHRRLGMGGAALAIGVVLAGVHATLRQPGFYAANGEAPPFPVEILVIGNIAGFLLFAMFVAAAVLKRRDAAAHKRLIYWACIVTMGPALTPGRSLGAMILPYFPMSFPPEIALGWIAWIALLLHDWQLSRRFHPVTIIGGMLILFIGPALVDWTLMIDAVTVWARAPL